MELARSMLKAKEMPNEFWGDAVTCAVYLLNGAATKSVQGMIPQEAWSGIKPCISHLRVFGSRAYSHVPDEKRGKMDDKSEKCILVGYSENSKAYSLYNPISKKIIITRDVHFNEGESSKWNVADQKQKSISVNIEDEEGAQGAKPEGVEPLSSTSSSPSSNEESTLPSLRRSIRPHQPSKRYSSNDYVMVTSDGMNFALLVDVDPKSFEEASKEEKWRIAMNQEIDAIERNKTWELTDLPKDKTVLSVKWVYKTKLDSKGKVDKNKARLLVKGYKQKFSVDYEKILLL